MCAAISAFSQEGLKEVSLQASERKSGKLVENLSPRDIELLVDGNKTEIVSLVREKRPLSVVVVVVTTPWTPCFDDLGFHLYQMGRSFSKTLAADDDVAVVLTDQGGTVQRGFSQDRKTLETDLSLAEKIARDNYFDSGVDEYAMTRKEGGLIFPLAGLNNAVKLLSERSIAGDRLILFARHMENTRSGERTRSKELLEKLLLNNIAVSWIGSTARERLVDLESVEYGSRNFFLALSNVSGGFFQPCRETASVLELFKDAKQPDDPDSELRLFLDRIKLRYRIKFNADPKQPGPKQILVTFRNRKFQKKVSLDFPKVIY